MAIHSAKGALLKLGDGASPEVFTTISQVRSISGPAAKATVQDITTHSTSGNWREKLSTIIDPGNLTFNINYDPADSIHAFATGIWNLLINLTLRNYKLVFSASAGTLAFAGYQTSHVFSVPVDNVLDAALDLVITGAITASNP